MNVDIRSRLIRTTDVDSYRRDSDKGCSSGGNICSDAVDASPKPLYGVIIKTHVVLLSIYRVKRSRTSFPGPIAAQHDLP